MAVCWIDLIDTLALTNLCLCTVTSLRARILTTVDKPSHFESLNDSSKALIFNVNPACRQNYTLSCHSSTIS